MEKDVRNAMRWTLESFGHECREITDSELIATWYKEFYQTDHKYRIEIYDTSIKELTFRCDSIRKAQRLAILDWDREVYTLLIETETGEVFNVAELSTIEDALQGRL